jgi:MFS family permease
MAMWLMRLLHDDWREFWVGQALIAVVVGAIAVLLVGSPGWLARRAGETDREVADEAARPRSSRVYRTVVDWTAREATRTPQFYVLLAAYFGHLLVGITIASWSVAHLTERGVSLKVAGVMLGVESLVGAAGRTIAGAVGDVFDPRLLLLISLTTLAVGACALSIAPGSFGDGDLLLLIYAVGSGLGFGMTALAVTLLLLNYYGRRHNLEIFSLTCLIGAVSALGPVIAGAIRDRVGGFGLAFQLDAALIGVIFIAAALMRPPQRAGPAAASRGQSPDPKDLSVDLVQDRA